MISSKWKYVYFSNQDFLCESTQGWCTKNRLCWYRLPGGLTPAGGGEPGCRGEDYQEIAGADDAAAVDEAAGADFAAPAGAADNAAASGGGADYQDARTLAEAGGEPQE